ncbi:YcxB family protein [Paenibacillus sp. JDR-2]|uniref:YcxB family protein n=1 Tax=Paenibacillus sp. (strain JDR-2) TaxID=324057 RepID=UPI000166B146|nr:YcxB family protein [Paenibacillus sp. JDR-2]ACS99247.1 hypothetical protein Pjdr2_0568 [Paenibacillus sp. JDR-2]
MQGSCSVTLTKEDLVKLQLTFLKKKAYPWILGFMYLMSLLNIIIVIVDRDISSLNPFMIFIFIFVPLFAILLVKGHKKNINNRFLREEKKYTWSDEGMILESDSLTVRMQWEDFTGLFATKSAIYLLVNGVTAHIFPRRSFTEEEWSQFKHATRSRVTRKKSYRWARNLLVYIAIFVVTVGIIQYFNAS